MPDNTQSVVRNVQLLRDENVMLAGVPFRRLMVYRLEVALPLSPDGVSLFSISKSYTIGSITVASSHPFAADAAYFLFDIADGETIGVLSVRAGNEGTFPIAVPELPAGLSGPSNVFIKYAEGIQELDGNLIVQISVSGPPGIGDGLFVDVNEDGIPDDLAEVLLPLPPLTVLETYDDFYAGYNRGLAGTVDE